MTDYDKLVKLFITERAIRASGKEGSFWFYELGSDGLKIMISENDIGRRIDSYGVCISYPAPQNHDNCHDNHIKYRDAYTLAHLVDKLSATKEIGLEIMCKLNLHACYKYIENES